MHRIDRRHALTLFASALTAAPALAQGGGRSAAKPKEITWDDLWPDGEDERLEELYNAYISTLGPDGLWGVEEGSAADKMPQIGSYTTVTALNNVHVRVPGYVVTLDFNARNEYSEFLIVPYFGACIHTPPPPPNQIILARATPPARIANTYDAYWFEGVLKTERAKTSLAGAAYTLQFSKLEKYQFSR